MRKIYGLLEHSVPIILIYFLISTLLYIFIGFKASIIIITIIFLSIGIAFFKSEVFYEKFMKILFIEEDYYNSAEDENEAVLYSLVVKKERDRYRIGRMYIVLAIFALSRLPENYYHKGISGSEAVKSILEYIVLLMNSIAGVYLYKKFKNRTQYIFSLALMVGILIAIVLIAYYS